MITTTLNRIRAFDPCADDWEKLLAGLGKTRADNELLPYAAILRINGIDDALWACRVEPQHASKWRLFAVWCARRVQHLMTDQRSVAALDVAERHAIGDATDAELAAARVAAWVAARVSAWDAAGVSAGVAAWDAAGVSAGVSAWDAARVAARDAAGVAAWDAAGVAAWDAAWDAARAAARVAAWDTAWDAARVAQSAEFLRVVGNAEELGVSS